MLMSVLSSTFRSYSILQLLQQDNYSYLFIFIDSFIRHNDICCQFLNVAGIAACHKSEVLGADDGQEAHVQYASKSAQCINP